MHGHVLRLARTGAALLLAAAVGAWAPAAAGPAARDWRASPSAPAAPQVVLWDQTTTPHPSSYAISSNYDATFDGLDSIAADDFENASGGVWDITQVAVIEHFPNLRLDLDAVVAAGTMVEASDAVAQEDQSSLRLFLLLQRGLRALESGMRGNDLITSYLLKLADVVGVAPSLSMCAACGRSESLLRFSFSGGGVLCDRCGSEGSVRLRPGLTEHLANLAATDFLALPGVDTALSGEAMGVARRFVEYHLDRKLASLAVMD